MAIEDILISLIPAIGWGLMPIFAKLTGGNAKEQMLGTTLAAFLVGSGVYFYDGSPFVFPAFWISLGSGLLWFIGQYLVFVALEQGSISRVVPWVNGTQLTGAVLASAFLLQEWNTTLLIYSGILGILFIIAGVYLANYSSEIGEGLSTKVIATILLSSFLMTFYVTLNKFFNISGLSIIFPQSIGMVMGALGSLVLTSGTVRVKVVLANLSTGFSWGIANLAMFISSITLGMAAAFTLGQLCVPVAALTSILLFKEKKTTAEWVGMGSGILLILIGALGISFPHIFFH